MSNEALILNDVSVTPQILFADHATDFGSAPATAANSLILGTATDCQIDTTSLAASGGSRQSAKFDFGASRAPLYRLDACVELATTGVDNEFIDFYLGGSPSGTAGTGNPAGLTGSDAAFTETDGLLGKLQKIGPLWVHAATLIIGYVGLVVPQHRYGILVVENSCADAFAATVDEIHFTLTPITYGN